jgi:hypothetical protein
MVVAGPSGDPTMRSATAAQPDQREGVTSIEIEVQTRWDALALLDLLIPYHSFLVQHNHDRWIVHARALGYHGRSLSDALEAIHEWRNNRGFRAVSCRIGGRRYELGERGFTELRPQPGDTRPDRATRARQAGTSAVDGEHNNAVLLADVRWRPKLSQTPKPSR